MSKRATRNFKKRQAKQRELQAEHQRGIVINTERFDIEARHLNDWVNVGTEGHIDHGPKGQKGGRCNVTACQRPGAVFQNVGMISTGGSWYCHSCATDIHNANTRDVENGCGFTLFPEFDRVLDRYMDLRFERKDPHDISLYEDIDQNPWGSCYHFDRDKYLEIIHENSNG